MSFELDKFNIGGKEIEVVDKTAREQIEGFQPKADSSLATTDKTVVGAINELNSDLNDLYTLDWDNIQTVGDTFTPTKNGLLVVNAGGGAGTYVQIYDVTANLNLANSVSQSIGNLAVNSIVTKNRQVTISTNGVNAIQKKFIPFK